MEYDDMGFDLRIFPICSISDKPVNLEEDKTINCRDSLEFDRQGFLIGQIGGTTSKDSPLYGKEIPKGLKIRIFRNLRIEETDIDQRECRLDWVLAGAFKAIKIWPDDPEISPKNKSILAFLYSLPENTPVILYWE